MEDKGMRPNPQHNNKTYKDVLKQVEHTAATALFRNAFEVLGYEISTFVTTNAGVGPKI